MLSFDPVVALALCVAAALYLRAVRVLGARGYRVGLGQRAAWWAGLSLVAAGLLSPVDRLAEDLLSAHMAQHLLIAEGAGASRLPPPRSARYRGGSSSPVRSSGRAEC